MPHRTTVKARLVGLCNTLKAEVQAIMPTVKFMSITDDGWTSRGKDSYLIITGHWLSDDFKPYNCVLAVKPKTESHTAEALVKVVIDCLFVVCFVLNEYTLGKTRVGRSQVFWHPCLKNA